MMQNQFLAIKKLKGNNIILLAAKHNLREIVAEFGAGKDSKIDPSRIGKNIILRGHDTAVDVANMADSLLINAKVPVLRKDAVRALEIIASLPPDSAIDAKQFFDDFIKWVDQYFNVPVISAVIHNDEAAPHCHVLLLPLANGRMKGSDLMGNKAKLQAMQADFHGKVAQGYGFTRQLPQKRLSATIRQQAIDAAHTELKARGYDDQALLRVLLEPHFNDPAAIMLVLGLAMPTTAAKARVKAAPAKPTTAQTKPIGFDESKPIGFEEKNRVAFSDVAPPENHQTLSCVGFCDAAKPIPAFTAPQHKPIQDDYKRQHDADQPSIYWDESKGEFIAPPIRTPTGRTGTRLKATSGTTDAPTITAQASGAATQLNATSDHDPECSHRAGTSTGRRWQAVNR